MYANQGNSGAPMYVWTWTVSVTYIALDSPEQVYGKVYYKEGNGEWTYFMQVQAEHDD